MYFDYISFPFFAHYPTPVILFPLPKQPFSLCHFEKNYMPYNIYFSESSLFYLPWFHFCFLHICYNLIYLHDWVNSNPNMFHIFFIHSSMDGHLGWFYFLAIVVIAEIITSSQIFLLYGEFHSSVNGIIIHMFPKTKS